MSSLPLLSVAFIAQMNDEAGLEKVLKWKLKITRCRSKLFPHVYIECTLHAVTFLFEILSCFQSLSHICVKSVSRICFKMLSHICVNRISCICFQSLSHICVKTMSCICFKSLPHIFVWDILTSSSPSLHPFKFIWRQLMMRASHIFTFDPLLKHSASWM